MESTTSKILTKFSFLGAQFFTFLMVGFLSFTLVSPSVLRRNYHYYMEAQYI